MLHQGTTTMPRLISTVVGRLLVLVGCATAVITPPLSGQVVTLADRGPRFLRATPNGAAPAEVDASSSTLLRRMVSLHLRQATVGSVLAAMQRQTGVRFVYSRMILPVDRPVGLRADSITVAAALMEILVDAGVDVVLSSGNQIVLTKKPAAVPVQNGAIVGLVRDAKTQTALTGATVVVQGVSHIATTGSDGHYRIADLAPGTYTVRVRYIGYAPGVASVTVSAEQEATADFSLERSAQRLDEVVTTGTVVPTEVKALPTPISIVSAEDIQQQQLQRVDQVFRGTVPGAIAWDQGPGQDYYTTVAVRGASALQAIPSIKTFVDGVEVAGPNYIATIDPNSVDRIEITRGPQASTLYGAGALSGVMQIFTKKGQLGLTRPEVAARVSSGATGGYDGRSTAFATDNAVSVLGGGEKASYNLNGSYRQTGEWVPNYKSADWGASAGAQTVQGPLTLSTSLRYADKTFNDPWDTRWQSYTYFSRPFYRTSRVRQQTYGLTASLHATPRWQHTLTLGYDQTYQSQDQTQPRLTIPSDSFLQAVMIHVSKVSLLYHTDLSLRLGARMSTVVTAGVNYETNDLLQSQTFDATRTIGTVDGSTSLYRAPSSNTGYFGQVQINLHERLFLTGGLRAEQNPNFGTAYGTAWSPRAGAAYVLGHGPATVKLRASYGESIRAPDPGLGAAVQTPSYQVLANPNLAPERQRGADAGFDTYLGRVSLGVTYYNQRAIDLLQFVTVPTPAGTLLSYQWQNVTSVKNKGWEFEVNLPLGPVQLAGTYSIAHSIVQALPPDFPSGQLQAGDQILGVPRSSGGAHITYSPLPQTTLTASMTYIGHWTNYDFVPYYGFLFGGQSYRGSERAYWIDYPTITKFAVGVSQVIRQNVTAFMRAENLGNNQRYEDVNTNIPMPRSVLVGATVQY
jgi:outer membrane receptor protein involved in Fe transport